jgi:cytochrome c oxidase accessory protein FixG
MEELKDYRDQSFRDSLTTIEDDGKRKWVYPKKPKGKLTNWRWIVATFLLVFFFAAPIIKIGGNPLLMFNFTERKFVLFSVVFWPQDSFIFLVMMLSLVIFVILFTVTFGRLWCGWACPQTIFMEFIFRNIEYMIEGSPAKQKKLNEQSWNFEKIWKKGTKKILFLAVSFLIINTFITYLIGFDGWKTMIGEGIGAHKGEFAAMTAFSIGFFVVYSYFREQICLIACPYGRLQGVLLDSKSIVVAYDYVRGEPRKPLKKGEDRTLEGKGDCIDCYNCVKVCPTAIDIRNGTQLECINCTACIDECNRIMDMTGKPRGLIRYDSENGIKNKEKLRLSPRIVGYSMVLLSLLTLLSFILITRSPIDVNIVRTPNSIFNVQEDGFVSNVFNLKTLNKSNDEREIEVRLLSHEGKVKLIGGDTYVMEPQSKKETVFLVLINQADLKAKQFQIKLGVFENGELVKEFTKNFMGPGKAK